MNTKEHATYSEEEYLPVSLLQHFLFCPRRAFLVHNESIWSDNIFTAHGQALHERVHAGGVESRKDLLITRGLMLCNRTLGLTGKADLVEFRRLAESECRNHFPNIRPVILDGRSGRWMAHPVEYKSGRLRHEIGYEVQLCAQAMCLEEMLNTDIPNGSIYYGKTGRRLDVCFSNELRQLTTQVCDRLHNTLDSTAAPLPVYGKKCGACSIYDLCLPEIVNRKNTVNAYIKRTMASCEQDQE